MDVKIEEILDDFYKLYFKIEKLNVENSIRCLTTNEMHIIKTLANDKISINELAERLGITISTMSLAISKLEKKLFLIREKDEKDKRKIYVYLSEKGKIAYNFQGDFEKSLFETIIKGVDKKDIKTFKKVLSHICSKLYDIKKELEPVALTNIKEKETANIYEIRANDTLLKYLVERGLSIGVKVQILEKNKNAVTLKIGKKEKTISKEDASKIFCIKREKL